MKKEEGVRYLFSLDPSFAGWFEHAAGEAGVRVLSSDFRWDASFEVSVPAKNEAAFVASVTDVTSGEAIVEKLDD